MHCYFAGPGGVCLIISGIDAVYDFTCSNEDRNALRTKNSTIGDSETVQCIVSPNLL